MSDRPESYFRVRTSEDKVCRKDWCWSVRAVYVLKTVRCKLARPRGGGTLQLVHSLGVSKSRVVNICSCSPIIAIFSFFAGC